MSSTRVSNFYRSHFANLLLLLSVSFAFLPLTSVAATSNVTIASLTLGSSTLDQGRKVLKAKGFKESDSIQTGDKIFESAKPNVDVKGVKQAKFMFDSNGLLVTIELIMPPASASTYTGNLMKSGGTVELEENVLKKGSSYVYTLTADDGMRLVRHSLNAPQATKASESSGSSFSFSSIPWWGYLIALYLLFLMGRTFLRWKKDANHEKIYGERIARHRQEKVELHKLAKTLGESIIFKPEPINQFGLFLSALNFTGNEKKHGEWCKYFATQKLEAYITESLKSYRGGMQAYLTCCEEALKKAQNEEYDGENYIGGLVATISLRSGISGWITGEKRHIIKLWVGGPKEEVKNYCHMINETLTDLENRGFFYGDGKREFDVWPRGRTLDLESAKYAQDFVWPFKLLRKEWEDYLATPTHQRPVGTVTSSATAAVSGALGGLAAMSIMRNATDDEMSSQINPATGLLMNGSFDVAGNAFGTNNSMVDINPGSGLPTTAGIGSYDIAGNSYGTSDNQF